MEADVLKCGCGKERRANKIKTVVEGAKRARRKMAGRKLEKFFPKSVDEPQISANFCLHGKIKLWLY